MIVRLTVITVIFGTVRLEIFLKYRKIISSDVLSKIPFVFKPKLEYQFLARIENPTVFEFNFVCAKCNLTIKVDWVPLYHEEIFVIVLCISIMVGANNFLKKVTL